MMRALSVSLIVGLSGCSSCDDPAVPAPDAPRARAEEDPAPATTVAEPAPSEVERPGLAAPPASEAAPRRALLAEGRRLERAGDHAGAIERYRRALAIAPGDATLLAELGWALFRADRLDEAFEATRDAYERAESDTQRGSILYNLGRIAEALGQQPRRSRSIGARSPCGTTTSSARASSRSAERRPAGARCRSRRG